MYSPVGVWCRRSVYAVVPRLPPGFHVQPTVFICCVLAVRRCAEAGEGGALAGGRACGKGYIRSSRSGTIIAVDNIKAVDPFDSNSPVQLPSLFCMLEFGSRPSRIVKCIKILPCDLIG